MTTHDRHQRMTVEMFKAGWSETYTSPGRDADLTIRWHHGHGCYCVTTLSAGVQYLYTSLHRARDTVGYLLAGKEPYYKGDVR